MIDMDNQIVVYRASDGNELAVGILMCKICTIFRFTRKAIIELNGEEAVSLWSKFLTLEVVGICGQMF